MNELSEFEVSSAQSTYISDNGIEYEEIELVRMRRIRISHNSVLDYNDYDGPLYDDDYDDPLYDDDYDDPLYDDNPFTTSPYICPQTTSQPIRISQPSNLSIKLPKNEIFFEKTKQPIQI